VFLLKLGSLTIRSATAHQEAHGAHRGSVFTTMLQIALIWTPRKQIFFGIHFSMTTQMLVISVR
jgi:hypothetical protein